jgi:hypothetical protein
MFQEGTQMPELKLKSIKIGEPDRCHFVSFTSGEHRTAVIGDRHTIDVEVNVPASTNLGQVEDIAREKAQRFIKELAASF